MSEEKKWVQQPKGEGGGGDHNPTWEPEVGGTIEGTLTGSKPDVGKYSKTVYDLKTDDGTTYSVWGTTVLEKKMADIAINAYIKIEYLGKVQGKGNAYHDYNVFVAGEQAPASAAEPQAAAAPAPAAEPMAAQPAPEPAAEAQPPAAAQPPEEGGDVPF